MLGTMARNRGDLSSASMYFKQTLATAQAMKSKWTEANALLNLGRVVYSQGEFQQMKTLVSQSIALRGEMGLPAADRLWILGFAEVNLEQIYEAVQHFKECLKTSTDNNILIVSLIGIARAMLQSNRPRIAAQLLGAANPLIGELNYWVNPFGDQEYELAWDELQKHIDPTTLKKEFEEGHRLTLEEAVSLALDVKFTPSSHEP